MTEFEGGQVAQLRALSQPDTQAALLDPNWLEVLAPWLGRLCLLYGVPVNHLVPDARMLPPESVRFFFLDRNWLDSLLDGAFSVGKGSTRDDLHHAAALEQVRQTSHAAARTVRDGAGGGGAGAGGEDDAAGPMSGLLLRSAVVSGWPGLEVRAFGDDGCTSALKPLRVERLAPDVLLCIFDGVARCVEAREPAETLHFGLLFEGDDYTSPKQIPLRYLKADGGRRVGESVEGRYAAAVMRKDPAGKETRVLRLAGADGTLEALRQALDAAGALSAGTLSPGEFAVQMVESAEQQVFSNKGLGTT